MSLSIGEKIRILMNRRGMTLGTLAESIGTTRQNLSNKLSRDNFSEKEIRLELKDGRKLIVSGEKLKISLFNKQGGTLGAEGKVFSVRYSSGENIFKKLIK